jgi:xylulokinase
MPPQPETTIGIDIGTTSVKAVAVDRDGIVVERVRIPHSLLTPTPGQLEHDPAEAWMRGPLEAMKAVSGHNPVAVAVTAMAPSMAAVDASGTPFGPGLLYGDERAHHEEGDSGSGGISSHEGEQMLRHLVTDFPRAAGYWPAAAVANHALSGIAALDFTSAITSGALFAAASGGWDAGLVESAGATLEQLPSLAVSGGAIGSVTGTEVVLAGGGVDVFSEQLVAGATEIGDVLVLCGTTLIVWTVTGEHMEFPGLWTVPGGGGHWMSGGASNAGGLFLGWASSLLEHAGTGPAMFPHAENPSDVPVWLPYVRGERTPFHDPTLRSSLHNLSLTHGPSELKRAAWEAAGFVVRHHVELTGQPAKRIVAVGGGTRVDGWIQAMADATSLPVHVADVPEGAALGAAYCAGLAVGHDEGAGFPGAARWARTGHIVEPDSRWTAPTAERYAQWRELGPDVTA